MNDTTPPGGTSDTGSTGTQAPPPPYTGQGPRTTRDEIRDLARLRRSTSERKIAGVAGGIARHLDIDPVVVRIALVVLVFFGGGGILLYGAAWLLVPDDTGDSVVRLDDRSRTVALAIVGALTALSLVGDAFGGWEFPWPLAVAGIVLVVVLATGKGQKIHQHAMKYSGHGHWHGPQRMHGWHGTPDDAPLAGEDGEPLPYDATGAPYAGYQSQRPPWQRRDPRKKGPILFGFAFGLVALAVGVLGTIDLAGADILPSAYPATILAVIGLMLVVGAFFGRAGGLIFFGLIAAVVTAATSITSSYDAGEIRSTPDSAAEVADSYHLDLGEIELDLTEVEDLEELDGETIDIDLNVGRISVVVPDEGLTVNVDANLEGVGEAKVFGDKSGNSLTAQHVGGTGTDVPVLTIDATNYVGEIDIQTVGSN